MSFDTDLKQRIYSHVAETTRVPTVAELAQTLNVSCDEAQAGLARLYKSRIVVLERDGVRIRMAPPFSGVPTQHRVTVKGKEYFANCAWDAFGVCAALHAEGEVHSSCAQSAESITIKIGKSGPEYVKCAIHFAVPAAHWWDDIVYT